MERTLEAMKSIKLLIQVTLSFTKDIYQVTDSCA